LGPMIVSINNDNRTVFDVHKSSLGP